MADDPVAIYNNCGPLQQCLDLSNVNNGFSSFDNMPSSLLSLFQALSTDGQYQIMWACLQSEPELGFVVISYFLAVGIIVGQVLINVFVAVLANVLGHYRALFNQAMESHFADEEESLPADSKQGISPGASKHGNSPSLKPGAVDVFGSSSMSLLKDGGGDKGELAEREGDRESSAGSGKEGPSKGVGNDVNNIVSKDVSRMTRVASSVFRSDFYNTLKMLAIFGNCMSLALIGSLGSARLDGQLEEINARFGLYFLVDFVLQLVCDGSFGKYFASGKHIYDFVVNVPTTFAIVVEAFGGSRKSTTVLRSMGILRILRGCEFFFLRPIWLMLLEAARSATLVMNLVLVLLVFLTSYLCLGQELFVESSLDARANFDSFIVGFMTLFQIMTGDSWSGLMYVGMNSACFEDTETVLRDSVYAKYLPEYTWTCYPATTLLFAMYHILFFVVGQYVFITLFLALILENFQVTNFMTIGEDKDADAQLIREEAYEVVAKYHMLPVEALDYELIEKAFQDYADFPSSIHAVISNKKLMRFVSSKKPMFVWRLVKMLGLVYLRYLIRAHCLPFRCAKLMPAYPGDKDWRSVGKVVPMDGEGNDKEGHEDQAEEDPAQVKKKTKKTKKKSMFFCLRRSFYFTLAQSQKFAACVYTTIIASSVMLALETPAEQVSRSASESAHLLFTCPPILSA